MQRVSFKYTYCLLQMQMCHISKGDTGGRVLHFISHHFLISGHFHIRINHQNIDSKQQISFYIRD